MRRTLFRRGRLPRRRVSLLGALLIAVTTTVTAMADFPDTVPVNCGTTMGGGQAGAHNIVFVLADDLSMNLLPYMPHVQSLEQSGTTFTNYTVADSLCCPSRASIFTGRYPHDTGVFGNTGADGGINAFDNNHLDLQSFNVSLSKAGYRTAMMGKYLNLYNPKKSVGDQTNGIPPDWTEWDVAGSGYKEFNYDLNENGTVVHYGTSDYDYLTDVLARRAQTFIATCAVLRAPFLLEVAPFAPHAPYVPAPRDVGTFASTLLPTTPAYNALPRNAPSWLPRRTPLSAKQVRHYDDVFRLRIEACQAIDQLLSSIEETLAVTGEASNTDIFFSSDNGYHIGEYRLPPGKSTAFDTDIRVPLVASGPGILPGHTTDAVVQNVDLAPTFEEIAHATAVAPEDGRSLVPLLSQETVPGWRQDALVEHHHVDLLPTDPDTDGLRVANPPDYEALWTPDYTYVEYSYGPPEFYDRVTDPYELNNVGPYLPVRTIFALHNQLRELATCHGADACWAASQGRPIPLPSWLQHA